MAETKDILIEVKGVSKKFSRNLNKSLWYGLQDMTGSVIGQRSNQSELRKDEFWAVKDINFTLKRGECLGLIGRNGAGKSTLLKMLNGLIRPDEGSITMRGKVGALIELGAGFNPLLSGRENIFINGQILGFSKKEIECKLDAIIDFAEIGEFIDSPVQNYSSGMRVRLGFSVASQMEPDILLIDEVLAVGDLGFVLKCFNTIDELMPKTAVIFVSHSMPMVSRVSTEILLMEKGTPVYYGNNVSSGIDKYYAGFIDTKKKNIEFDRGGDAALVEIRLGDKPDTNQTIFSINRLDDLHVNLKIKVNENILTLCVALTVFDKEQRPIGISINENKWNDINSYKKANGFTFYKTKLTIPRINLSKGIYSFSLSVSETLQAKPLLRLRSVCEFQVVSKNDVWPPIEFEGIWT